MTDTARETAHPENESSTASGAFVVLNDRGLHTRPSTELVKLTSRFKAQLTLSCQGNKVNGKSMLGILTLAAPKGSRIRIKAEGVDAQELVDALLTLAANKFHHAY